MPPVNCCHVLLQPLARNVSSDIAGSVWATDLPGWITAVGTALLAVFAILTTIYAVRAFRKQSQEVRDQAEMLRVQSRQLDLRSQQFNDQREINAVLAEDLRESLKERARLRQDAEREQADKIGLRMSTIPFPRDSEGDVSEFDAAPGEVVHMAAVSNDSRRPIQNVVCTYGDLTAVMTGRLVDWQQGARLIEPLPRPSARVIRAGETYGFAFELNAHRIVIGGRGEAWFTDDAGLHWQLDEDLHLKQLPDRVERDRWAAEGPDEFP